MPLALLVSRTQAKLVVIARAVNGYLQNSYPHSGDGWAEFLEGF